MFEDEIEPKKKAPSQKNLENMGVAELETYIGELKAEIIRVEKEVEKKKAIRDRAASVFKN